MIGAVLDAIRRTRDAAAKAEAVAMHAACWWWWWLLRLRRQRPGAPPC